VKVIGIDTGGTFTDFVLWQDGALRVHKVLSTPAAPEQAILQGIAELGLDPAALRVIHGSTVATNAVLEGKGVRTACVTNRGLGDVLTIGRQARPDLYDLQPPPRQPPVPRELCLETGGRLGADGSTVEPVTDEDLRALTEEVVRLAPESVAINLLFSYLDDRAERAIVEALPAGLFVSRSSEVLPTTGEYERGIATWLNAWIGPLVARYLERLVAALPGAGVSVMQSSGDAVASAQTARQAVRLLLSGPAGGLVGAGFVGRLAGCERLLTFDMGGTSTDVALVDGAPPLTRAGRIAGYPVAVPMVDMHTIGAGGGSIARVDAGGALLVGPESAGADPGPACYGRGGREPNVTDANLVLGRLLPDAFLGGRMRFDSEAATDAIGRLAMAMGVAPVVAAQGIIALANEHMARALRVIAVQRGGDPRAYTLACFGGAGGLHVCALAEALGMTRALAPVQAGVLSALGMLVAPPGRVLSRTWIGDLAKRSNAEIEAQLDALAADGIAALVAEGHPAATLTTEYQVDLRYRGQSYTLDLPWRGGAATAAAFHVLHETRYGHRLELPVELVDLRARITAPGLTPQLAEARQPSVGARRASRSARAAGFGGPVPVLDRAEVLAAYPARTKTLVGPAIVVDDYATTWLAAGWHAWGDKAGNLHVMRRGAP
jgi:N-methylhydantoinase A